MNEKEKARKIEEVLRKRDPALYHDLYYERDKCRDEQWELWGMWYKVRERYGVAPSMDE